MDKEKFKKYGQRGTDQVRWISHLPNFINKEITAVMAVVQIWLKDA
jgi:hypothetical protein